MQKAIWALAATAITLTACGNSTKESAAVTGTVSLHNASQAQVAEQVSAANGAGALMDPGRWEGSVKFLDMQVAGMDKLPPAIAAHIKAQMGQGTAFASCLTPEDDADAKRAFAEHQQGDCTYDHFTMADGTIDAAMTCHVGTALQKMTLTGSYSRTDYRIVSQASGGADGPAGPMSMKMEMAAHRVGACTGTEDKPGGK